MKTAWRGQLDCLRVYPITDRALLPGDRFLRGIEAAFRGGVRSLQLREKDLAPAELLALARRIKTIARRYGAKLFVNDRADIAELAGADGVHLPATGIPVAEVKKLFPRLLAGVSTHSLESARKAEADGADFITFSPIFDTPSKRRYGPPQGLDRLREVAGKTGIPVLALGGIKADTVRLVLDQGAYGVALISDIWSGADIEKTSYQYRQHFPGESL
jgi:thiamine-phosphate pyrophosphorylase